MIPPQIVTYEQCSRWNRFSAAAHMSADEEPSQ